MGKNNVAVLTEDNTLTGALTTTGEVTINGTTVIITDLPTSNPSVAGQLWSNSGVLTISAG